MVAVGCFRGGSAKEPRETEGSGGWSGCGGVGVREACCCVVRVEGGLAGVDGGESDSWGRASLLPSSSS